MRADFRFLSTRRSGGYAVECHGHCYEYLGRHVVRICKISAETKGPATQEIVRYIYHSRRKAVAAHHREPRIKVTPISIEILGLWLD